jgi:uncharacterized protein involved in exopolysaccharide biosynthesis
MSKRDIIIFLFKWKYSIIGYFLFVIALVTTLLYVLPKKYPAMARVVIESNMAPVMRSSPAPGRIDALGVLYTELEIILSRTVLGSAVDRVKPHERPLFPNPWTEFKGYVLTQLEDLGLLEWMSRRDRWIRRLEKKLNVEPIVSSAVINISYSDESPEWAARMVNAVTDSYIAHHLKVYSSPGTVDVYRRQTERIKEELARQRRELEDFKRKTSVSALDHRKRSLVDFQGTMTSQLNNARAELAALLTKYEPAHSKVKLVKEKIDAITASFEETRNELQELELQQARIEEMEHAIASAEKSYREYQGRYEDARLNELANPEVVNVRVMEYAEVPRRPAHSRLFYVAISVVGGFILSLSIALIREYFDHRVADPDMAEELLGIPALGSIERI